MALINCPECQKVVSDKAAMCPYCGYEVKEHFQREAEKQRLEALQAAKESRNLKIKKYLKTIVPISILVLVVVVYIAVDLYSLSQRETFDNEEDMLSYLDGYWMEKDESMVLEPDYLHFLDGRGERLSETWTFGDELELNPQRGVVELSFMTIVLDKSGELVVETDGSSTEKVYERALSSGGHESGYSVLNVNEFDPSFKDSTLSISGKVENMGKLAYSNYLTLKYTATYDDGSTKEGECYITLDKNIGAGETVDYYEEIYIGGDRSPEKLRLQVLDYSSEI